MNIVFVAPFGLQPKQTVSGRALPLAQALARRGHRVRVVIPPWDWPVDSGRCFTLGGVEVSHLALPHRIPGFWHGLIAWRLLRGTLSGGVDVIHCFKPKGYAGGVAWAIGWAKWLGLSDARLVVDADDWEGSGGWNERGEYSRLARWCFARQERWGLSHSDAATCASRTLQSLAWSVGARQVEYLPNGLVCVPDLPTRAEARSHLGWADGPVALVYTRFVEIGPERLAGLLARLLSRVPELRVVVVGEGLRGEHRLLRRLLDGWVQASRVYLPGWVEREDLPPYWAAADLALYPCEDNLLTRAKSPLRLVEMMAAGLPIVAQGVGEVVHYLENGASGWTVEPQDEDSFVEAAVTLLRDPALRAYLGQGARDRVAAQFTWDRLVERAEAAYFSQREVT